MKDHDYNNNFGQTARKPTLTELARKFASDKLHNHGYLPHYERLLGNMKVHRLLELGIGYRDLMQPFLPKDVEYVHGSSLRMWSEYWPEANIYACDIREDALVNEGNIKSWVADQSKEHDLERLVANCGGKLDVVIDDGSHEFEHQRITLKCLLPWVMPHGGIMIVEDTYQDKGAELAKEFGGELIVGTKRPDDCLAVFRR